ncbi:MAPK regulated corepressor interacting protein 2-like isoform X1 [Ischnura elegans]|uniref:MAPK regulated corepressor interacting protein 2-like isoform X1 n=1 Tax=Ischnura elegans TaxID=197161 RepID=UPI001ED8A8CA|nr:MAPK regulated corepressor interacting protein 2-like isoform X1 [Ischnura elegans]
MYTISRGPSKFVAKTRRGLPQKLERLETLRDTTAKKGCDIEEEQVMNGPKPVFHLVNGKRSGPYHRSQQEVITPQHEDLIKFIYDSWNRVCKEYEDEGGENCHGSTSVIYYEDGEPNGVLQDFKPFDLESWWGKRLFNNITNSI